VSASSFPVGVSPLLDWNFLTAAIVESSHVPVGVPLSAPLLVKACWISLMRSEVGACCPFTFFALLFFPFEFLAVLAFAGEDLAVAAAVE
jgi:hypothetical protein